MKEITLKIPDQKFDFVMKLLSELGLEVSELNRQEIPEKHKAIVQERIRQSAQNPEKLLDWDQVKHQLKSDDQ